jgi:hypothetical protein
MRRLLSWNARRRIYLVLSVSGRIVHVCAWIHGVRRMLFRNIPGCPSIIIVHPLRVWELPAAAGYECL